MYVDYVACCPLVSHGEYAPTGQTDGRTGRTPDRCITLSARLGLRNDNDAYLMIVGAQAHRTNSRH